MINRRKFCKNICCYLAGATTAAWLPKRLWAAQSGKAEPFIREAGYYEKLADNNIRCHLCPKTCLVPSQRRGYCGVRENQGGTYKTLVYGRLTSINNDPIEKKPLFHFLPGTTALSVSTSGCNVHCQFCQNWNLSQVKPEELPYRYFSPRQLVELAQKNGIPTIAYTYNEPTIFTEYILDTARIGKELGVRSVHISNGYIQKEPLRDLCQVLDAIKIDFKAFSDDFYRQLVEGTLQPVLDTMAEIKKQGVWLEMVNLIIPTHNDDVEQLNEMCQWITDHLGTAVPLHFTRFHPQYRMKNLPPTPVDTLQKAHAIAKNHGLKYVYVGNVPGHQLENTFCPQCNTVLIKRRGFYILENKLQNSIYCPSCGTKIPGIWI